MPVKCCIKFNVKLNTDFRIKAAKPCHILRKSNLALLAGFVLRIFDIATIKSEI